MVGQRLDKYDLLEEVGSGGMAVVYRSRDPFLERDVAIKVLHQHLAKNPEARRRFLREARAVARLHHAGIMEIYSCSGDDSGRDYMVTEFIRGCNLREFAERNNVRSPEAAALCCLQLAGALEHAHRSGVIHRDVKPENVMVSDKGELKITDFGIAHVLEAERLTVTGSVIGSPAHMSPEQIEGKPSDRRSDVFSLGTIMYMLSTGRPPFSGDNPAAIFKSIMDGVLEDPCALNPAIDNRLARIMIRMLAPKPQDRQQDMVEISAELGAWLDDSGIRNHEAELSVFLKSPGEYMTGLPARVVPALRLHARRLLSSGKFSAAMSTCNRALALAPTDADTMKLLKSAGRSRAARFIAYPAAAAIAIGLVAYSYILAGERPDIAPAQVVPGAEAAFGPEPAPPAPETRTAPPAPEAVPGKAAASRQRPGKTSLGLLKLPSKMIVKSQPREVRIFVKPYADIYADGALIGEGRRDLVAALQPGAHRLEFRNPYFESQELAVDIPAIGDVRDIRVEMSKVRPAFLTIMANPSAEVFVDSVYKGLSGATIKEPVLITIPREKGTRLIRLRLTAEGYRPHEQMVELHSGATKNVKVMLEPKGK